MLKRLFIIFIILPFYNINAKFIIDPKNSRKCEDIINKSVNDLYVATSLNTIGRKYTEEEIIDIKKRLIAIDCEFVSNLIKQYD